MPHNLRLILRTLLMSAFVLSGSALDAIPEKVTQLPGGEIIFPSADAKSQPESILVWEYKPRRWGMYDVELVYENGRPGKGMLTIGEKSLPVADDVVRRPGRFTHALATRYYLEKSEPFELRLETESAPPKAILFRPAPEGKPIVQNADEIVLHARDATTHSVMMRYEPATNKNCLGYWTNPNDAASWSFEVTRPGTYEIELWQGCGKGQGGSVVSVQIDYPPQNVLFSKAGMVKRTRFRVDDTGHFQNFVPRNLGQVEFSEHAKYKIFVRPLNKKAAAVMDIRRIVLKPVADGAPARNPSLQSVLADQRVVFLGDSITYSGQFIEYLETWFRLQYPGASIDFINLGLPSETVSGLSEPGHADGQFPRPNLHERLERVLEKAKPDIIVACYGMNDGIYHPFSEERASRFHFGMVQLREKANSAGALLLHLTPPAFDPVPIKERTLPAGRDEYTSPFEGYNDVLDIYTERLIRARGHGWEAIDIHTPMSDFLAARRKTDPNFLLARDGVHVNDQGHWLIAREVLRYLGAPDELTSAAAAEALFRSSPRAVEIHKLVQKRQRLLKDAWLTHVGHQRPGMNRGKPLEEAQREAAEIDNQLKSNE